MLRFDPDGAGAQPSSLIVAGAFTDAGGKVANHIAVWTPSTSTWAITAMDLDSPNVTTNGQGDTLGNLARWDSTTSRWTSMGSVPGLYNSTIPPVTVVRNWTQPAGQRPTLLLAGSFVGGVGVWSSSSPYVTSIPSNPTSVCSNSNTTLSVSALANSPIYRWQRNGVNLPNGPSGNGSMFSGVDTPNLGISGAQPADSGQYSLNIFTTCGNVTTSPVTVSIAPCCGSADFNCDRDIGTDADIESFFSCLAGNCPPAPCTSSADFNADGDIGTDADIEAFFRVLAGGNC